MVKKWNRNKKHCKNCKHFYVCAYHKEFEINNFVKQHLKTNYKLDELKAQGKAREVIYKLLYDNCEYFNKNAYSNSYVWSKNR